MFRSPLALLLLTIAVPVQAQRSFTETLPQASAPMLIARYGADPLQRGELRLPSGKGPFPVAVLIHGGCWDATRGDLRDTGPLAEALAARGIATWNIEYRRSGNPGGGWPGTFDDIAAAIDHLAVLARSRPLDLAHVAVVGHDAGVPLALWAAARPTSKDAVADTIAVKPVTAVAIDGPGIVMPFTVAGAQGCDESAVTRFLGGTPAEKPAAHALASPQAHLPLGVHQLIVVGALGEQMAPYVQAALASGDTLVKLAPGGGDHRNVIMPGTPQGKQVADFIAAQAFDD
ncbi:alpha/beta hydrolase [uncultured Sphingomonas sp.]|uniref:alpha/beta hydrolase n=1 Tax=uncultured Sphingomonas sp. TaxID=158754 RepID=UPI0025EA16DE|nr:alpha/beta hydrolase [uncultured Sphingomonas sp.]